jgi:hypothetical protein
MEMFNLAVGALGLIIFFVFDLPTKIKTWFFSVYVTPKEITVDKSDWVTKTSIRVINNKSYPIYSVQLQLIETAEGSNIEDLIIKPESYFVDGIDMNAFVISTENKETKLRTKVVPLHQVNSQSSLNINITIPATQKTEKFKIKIVDYKKNPSPVREQGQATLVNFNLK